MMIHLYGSQNVGVIHVPGLRVFTFDSGGKVAYARLCEEVGRLIKNTSNLR